MVPIQKWRYRFWEYSLVLNNRGASSMDIEGQESVPAQSADVHVRWSSQYSGRWR